MKQAWKRLLIVLSFVFLVTLSIGVFTACGGNDDEDESEKTTYTFTVLLPNNDPAAGVKFTFTKADGGSDFSKEYTTDSTGKITAELPEDNYRISVVESTLPNGYAMSNDLYTINFRGQPQTVKLVPLSSLVKYSFKVTGPAGAPLNNIPVLYSATVTGNQSLLGQTNADGELSISVSAMKGYVFITPPNGFAYNMDYSDNTSYTVSNSGGNVSFHLLTNTRIPTETTMDNDAKNAFYKAINRSSTFKEAAIDKGRDAYTVTATLAAGETQYFVFRAPQTGEYTLYADKTSSCEVKLHGNSYNQSTVQNVMSPSKTMGSGMSCTAMQDFVISAKAEAAETVQFVIVAPPETNNYLISETGSHKVQIKEELPAFVSFRPATEGQYKFSILTEGNFTVNFANVNTTEKEIVFEIYNENLFNKDGNGNLTTEPTNSRWNFTVNTETQTYPVEITVKFERLGDPTETKKTVINIVEVQSTLSQYGAQQGKLTPVGVNGTNARVIKGSDGNYHLNAANGPIIVIQLKGVIEEYFDVAFEALDGDGGTPYMFDVTPEQDKNDPTKPYILNNYAKMLRGFAKMETDTAGNLIPGTPEGEYYIKYVNADGVYPLNDELKEFLQLYANANVGYLSSMNSTLDSLWLFSAFYYDNGDLPDPVPGIGDGTQDSPYRVEYGTYSITFDAAGTKYLQFLTNSFNAQAEISVNGSGVTPSQDIVSSMGMFTLTASSACTVKLSLTAPIGTSIDNPYIISDGYVFDVEIDYYTRIWAGFTANENAIYSFTFTSDVPVSAYEDEYLERAFTTENVIIKNGETVVFLLVSGDYAGAENVTVNIVKSAISTKNPTGGTGSTETPFTVGEMGLYAAEYNGTESVHYVLSAPGTYTIKTTDKNATIYANDVLTGEGAGFAITLTVENTPVEFLISSYNGKADTVYFEILQKEVNDKNHPFNIQIENSQDSYTGNASFIDKIEVDTRPDGTPIYESEKFYYVFTAQKDGYYTITLNTADANILNWDDELLGEVDWGTMTVSYSFLLKANEELCFALAIDESAVSFLPIDVEFTVTWAEPPAEGSIDLPTKVTAGTKTITLEANGEYYFEIAKSDVYTVTFSSADMKVYNLRGALDNEPQEIVSGFENTFSEWYSSYLLVKSEKGGTFEITFTEA